ERLLDAVLLVVAELVPTGGEVLDPVVRHRVVGGRDDRAECGTVLRGQVRDGRGGQLTHEQDVDALTGQARRERGLQHLPRRAGVPTDDGDGEIGRAHV